MFWDDRVSQEYNVDTAIRKTLKAKKRQGDKKPTYTRQQRYVMKHTDECIAEVTKSLKNKDYEFGKVRNFRRKEGDKWREINHLRYYPDAIICQAVMNVCQPMFISKYITNTYSSIKGRGLQDCVRKITKVTAKHKDWYALQIDVKKFYESIDHEVCLRNIRRVIKDKYTIEFFTRLLTLIKKGIAIGFSPNHYLANNVFSPIDHFFKEVLRVEYYFRYMDDVVMFVQTKEECHRLLDVITGLLAKEKLEVKNTVRIAPISYGIDFCGYVFYGTHVRLRKRIKINMKRKDRRLRKAHVDAETYKFQMASYYGWCKFGNCRNLLRKVFGEYLALYDKPTGIVRKEFISSKDGAGYLPIVYGGFNSFANNVERADW